MKTTSLISACLLAALLAPSSFALTTTRRVDPGYLRDHPDEFSVSVARGEEGLIEFTISHNVARPMYHVARLAIIRDGAVIATSDTPLYGSRRGNKFHFSLAPENLPESRFSLSDSAFSGEGENRIPRPGSIIHQFQLRDFVPPELLRPPARK